LIYPMWFRAPNLLPGARVLWSWLLLLLLSLLLARPVRGVFPLDHSGECRELVEVCENAML
jgi:hypothetical protein